MISIVVAQFYLSKALTGRDEALERLNHEVAELADLLDLERRTNIDLRSNLAQLSSELQSTLKDRDDFAADLTQLRGARDALVATLESMQKRSEKLESARSLLQVQLDESNATVETNKETIDTQLKQLVELQQDISAMKVLRDELERDLKTMMRRVEASDSALTSEREISAAAKAQVNLLNRQIAALREQMQILNTALEASEARDKEQKAQISDLGKRLNVALAGKVQELARYRSEFFGRLRDVLGDRPDIQIVGDRFIFQSEVLFESGSAEIGPDGKPQLEQLARTLMEDIAWILRIDGHTDRLPIRNERFHSNWELSTARAISVVKFLMRHGIPATRLAATGFGEFQPIDDRIDEIAFRRNRRIELKFTER